MAEPENQCPIFKTPWFNQAETPIYQSSHHCFKLAVIGRAKSLFSFFFSRVFTFLTKTTDTTSYLAFFNFVGITLIQSPSFWLIVILILMAEVWVQLKSMDFRWCQWRIKKTSQQFQLFFRLPLPHWQPYGQGVWSASRRPLTPCHQSHPTDCSSHPHKHNKHHVFQIFGYFDALMGGKIRGEKRESEAGEGNLYKADISVSIKICCTSSHDFWNGVVSEMLWELWKCSLSEGLARPLARKLHCHKNN